MSASRTVTIETVDHGTVTIPEPTWCIAAHDIKGYREDIEHVSAQTPLLIPTRSHGLVIAMPVFFVWRPFSSNDNQINAAIVTDVESHEFDPAGLDQVAAALVEHARTIRVYARQLSTLRAGTK